MKYKGHLTIYLLLFCVCFSCTSTTKKEVAIDPIEFEKAFNEYMILDYTYVDTIIKYELLDNEILLDFGNPEDTRWSVSVLYTNPDGSEKANTKLGKSYYLENGKLRLPYPDGINSKSDAQHFYVGAIPTGKSYISEYPKLYNPELTLFVYRQVSKQGVLKPTGENWYQMKDIIHKVNFMTNNKNSIEIREAIHKKKRQIVNRIRNR